MADENVESTSEPKSEIVEAVEPAVNASHTTAAYGESQIKALDDVEHVRARPGMYIGGYNPRGLHHLVYEIVDNSIDEALAGYAKHIDVRINLDGSCTVIDDGRGIPVGIHPDKGIPTVELVLTALAAAGSLSTMTAVPTKRPAGYMGSAHRLSTSSLSGSRWKCHAKGRFIT